MSLSQIARSIKPSPTLALNEKAAILREKGDPIIHLGGGEPKSRAPMDALLAAVNSLNSGEIRYAPADGTPDMKKAVIRYTEEYYHRKVHPENVIASGGMSSIEDVISVKKAGAEGVIIGKALYTGAIDLAEAIKVGA